MRIMFFTRSLQSGGAERVISTLANEFVSRNHEVAVTLISNPKCSYQLSPQVMTESLNCEDDLHLSRYKRIRLREKKIKAAVTAFSPDIIISFMANTNIDVCMALKKTKIPIIVSERNDPKIDPPGKIRRFLRICAYKRANGVVFQTKEAQDFFEEKIRKRSTIILNPLLSEIPKPYTGKRENRIVAVGRLEKQKNYNMLITAFSLFAKELPNWTLEIYGEGALCEQIESQAKECNISDKVFLKGFCANVHDEIRTAGMFVMTSDYEGLPNALIEAMALGIPCISTDCPCGGPAMLIESEVNGALINVADTSALVEKMLDFAKNSDKAKVLGEKAQEIRGLVDKDIIVDKWLNFISCIKDGEKK